MGKEKTIQQRLVEQVVHTLGVDDDEVIPTARFGDDLGADSLDNVELVMALEEEFDIEIPDSDAEKIVTVSDAIEYVARRVQH